MRFCVSLLWAFLAAGSLAAQHRPSVQLLAGLGANGMVSSKSPATYSRLLLPRLSAGLRIPLTRHVAILSGVDVQQKGFRNQNRIDDGKPGNYTIIEAEFRYSQLHIPLQVSVGLLSRKTWGLELAGGMSYGFLLRARGTVDWNFYRSDILIHTDRFPTEPRVTLLPYDNRIAAPKTWSYGALYLFNPAFAANATLRFRTRLLLQVYGEYNLYDAATVSAYPAHLYSLGLGIGYRL